MEQSVVPATLDGMIEQEDETLQDDHVLQDEPFQQDEILQETHHAYKVFRVYDSAVLKPTTNIQLSLLRAQNIPSTQTVEYEQFQDGESKQEDETLQDDMLQIDETVQAQALQDELIIHKTVAQEQMLETLQIHDIRYKYKIENQDHEVETLQEGEYVQEYETLEEVKTLQDDETFQEDKSFQQDENVREIYMEHEALQEDENFLDEEVLRDDEEQYDVVIEKDSESDIETANELCPTCLSLGRKMRPLGHSASRAYTMLLAGFQEEDQIEEFVTYARVCWECYHIMAKILQFQNQLLDANVMLQSYEQLDGSEKTAASFSRLSTVKRSGFDYEMGHAGPQTAPRKRGRPRKYPIKVVDKPIREELKPPNSPIKEEVKPSPTRRKRKYKKLRDIYSYASKVRNRRRYAKVLKVSIDDAELQRMRSEERCKPEYLAAAYRCDSCIRGFTFVSLLERHNRNMHSESAGAHQCRVCEVRFADEAQMQRHRRRHYTLHSCGECGCTYPLLGDVERHYIAAHEPGKTYPCGECGQIFLNTYPLLGDVDIAAHEPGKTYPCGECGQIFLQERKMRYHKETVHKPMYQCDYCNKTFKNMQVLRGHIRIHTGMPMLQCSICQKSCRGDTGLYAHMRSAHSRENPADAYCSECNVQFRNRDGYRFHLRHSVKHATPARLKFQCEKCSKWFLSETALRHHHSYYHLEYKCSICNKRLNSRYTYSKHIKFLHEGYEMPKKHVCEVCGKAFATAGQLRVHTRTHTGERPHACASCGASFAQRSTLRTHQNLIHDPYGPAARAGHRAADAYLCAVAPQ